MFLKVKPTLIYDLKKFYPSNFDEFTSFRKELVVKFLYNLIRERKEQRLYRKDVDPEFISKLSIAFVFSIFHLDLNEISEKDLMRTEFSDQFFIYHMNEICTKKGRKLFNELVSS